MAAKAAAVAVDEGSGKVCTGGPELIELNVGFLGTPSSNQTAAVVMFAPVAVERRTKFRNRSKPLAPSVKLKRPTRTSSALALIGSPPVATFERAIKYPRAA